jgi:hypothetical protein
LGRSAETPSSAEWSAWADDVIGAADSSPPEWLCDLSLGKTADGLAAWLRPTVDLGAGSILFGVRFLLFKIGRVSLDELVLATLMEFIDSESVGWPIPGWEAFKPIRDWYDAEGAVEVERLALPAELPEFFEPHVRFVRLALERIPHRRG